MAGKHLKKGGTSATMLLFQQKARKVIGAYIKKTGGGQLISLTGNRSVT